jgi:serine/threonine-protein kinase HipA
MARTLDVYLHEGQIGPLIQDDGGEMSFECLESWLAKPDAAALSQSLPLRKERFPAKACLGYFGGILPEESKREIIARNLGLARATTTASLNRSAANARER